MIVVSDASPIIGLAAADQLDLLRTLFQQVLIPTAVYEEISSGEPGAPGVREINEAGWIRAQDVRDASLVEALRTRVLAAAGEGDEPKSPG